eukprot:TRINITY_DN14638_c0_g1_i2.p1 TRINITY_DN14638_c0_g1~~TRINITY_DN14638_c0_g1_i2.p1  ORF type:complete len:107 (-),score=22.66 TRINITY_DN14638_c0_g1_i2:232-552(-)
MIRRPPRSTQSRSSAASDVYKRQVRELPQTTERNRVQVLRPNGEDLLIDQNRLGVIGDPCCRVWLRVPHCLREPERAHPQQFRYLLIYLVKDLLRCITSYRGSVSK